MSEVTRGILNMPRELWMNNEVAAIQVESTMRTACKELDSLREKAAAFDRVEYRNHRLIDALDRISKWTLPMLDDGNGGLASYGIMRGSNGERDFIRNVAVQAMKDNNSKRG